MEIGKHSIWDVLFLLFRLLTPILEHWHSPGTLSYVHRTVFILLTTLVELGSEFFIAPDLGEQILRLISTPKSWVTSSSRSTVPKLLFTDVGHYWECNGHSFVKSSDCILRNSNVVKIIKYSTLKNFEVLFGLISRRMDDDNLEKLIFWGNFKGNAGQVDRQVVEDLTRTNWEQKTRNAQDSETIIENQVISKRSNHDFRKRRHD